jgi:predicted NAD/FAD-dependent oxidoreductase
MRGLCDHLARDLDVRLETMVNRVEAGDGGWRLHTAPALAAGEGHFDAVLVTAPSPQALELLRAAPALAAEAAAVQWDPCWAAMLALAKPSQIEFDAAFFNDDPILGWAARDSAKPQRATGLPVDERWVLHAKPRWSRQFFEMDADTAAQWLARAFAARMRRPLLRAHLIGHRWRYATPINPLTRRCLWESQQRIGVAGDWCHGPRIEGAWLSGRALAAVVAG